MSACPIPSFFSILNPMDSFPDNIFFWNLRVCCFVCVHVCASHAPPPQAYMVFLLPYSLLIDNKGVTIALDGAILLYTTTMLVLCI